MKTASIFVISCLLSLSTAAFSSTDPRLGRLWTFEAPPLAYLVEEYGFAPDGRWLDSLRLGSLRLGDEDAKSGLGSASFVSPHGLILTSTRCVRDAVTATRPRDLRIINEGFVADTPDQEFRLKTRRGGWLTAAQLVRTTDVTGEVDEGVLPTDEDVTALAKRDTNTRSILAAARVAAPDLASEIANLHGGRTHLLYQYRVYDDIRLVVLPHARVANFGGAPYGLDFAFLRAYVDGQPADTARQSFTWGERGVTHNELVFVVGHPGTTRRLSTTAQLEVERDVRLPMAIDRLQAELRIWRDPASGTYAGDFDPENPSRYWSWVRTDILKLESDLRSARVRLKGLQNDSAWARRVEMERDFRARVLANDRLAETYHDLWDESATLAIARRDQFLRSEFYGVGGVFELALAVVQASDPSESESTRGRAVETLERWADGTVNLNFHGLEFLKERIDRARRWLPASDPFLTLVLEGKTGEEFLQMTDGAPARSSSNWIGYSDRRTELVEAGWASIQASDDPVILAARQLANLIRENERWGAELDAKEAALASAMADAWLACCETTGGPDGTGTLRFSDGVVGGGSGKDEMATTTLHDLFDRNAEADNRYPLHLPDDWLERRNEIDLRTPLGFTSTNDVSRGSRGSVVVNAALEVVGVVSRGNDASLRSEYGFEEEQARTVVAHADAILEVLSGVYGAHRIVQELAGR